MSLFCLMRHLFWLLCGFVVGLVLCYVLTVLLVHAHEAGDPLAWMTPYTSADGTRCCNAQDCFAVPVRLLALDADTVTAEVAGVVVTVPRQSMHQSETVQTYVCCKRWGEACPEALRSELVRCLFVAVGG